MARFLKVRGGSVPCHVRIIRHGTLPQSGGWFSTLSCPDNRAWHAFSKWEVNFGNPVYLPQIVQLTSLCPTADLFCSLLCDALKVELQHSQIKFVRPFARTCYSEALVSETSSVMDNEREDGSLISEEKDDPIHGGIEKWGIVKL